jgi:hypothetical protein
MIDDNFWKNDVTVLDIYDLFRLEVTADLENPYTKIKWDLCHTAIHAIQSNYKKELVLKTLLEALEKIERTSL